jgi:iron(II)-dependent oxidoreductase
MPILEIARDRPSEPRSAGLRPPPGWRSERLERLVVHADDDRETALAFALSVAAGLDASPRWLDSQYLYDASGSSLFERITEQPEYYQTRTEDGLLARHAGRIREIAGDVALVELGSGTSTKTRRLLDAWAARGQSRYIPVDISLETLASACRDLSRRYPRLSIEAVAASYERALPLLPQASPMLLAFLGSSLGNLGRHGQREFLGLLADNLRPGDLLLVGLDFAHDAGTLEAAYADAAGFTARFTRNLFGRMNRELGSDIPVDAVKHVSFYNPQYQRIEIYADFRQEVCFRIPLLDRSFRIARGERIRTEVSHKYRPEAVSAAVERYGFRLEWRETDERQRFGLFLWRRRAASVSGQAAPRLRWMSMLDSVRRRTLDIVAPLGEADLMRQHSPHMSPIVWDLGHVASFEHLWLVRRLAEKREGEAAGTGAGGRPPPEPSEQREDGEGLERLYDPLLTPRAERRDLPLPTTAETRRGMDEVRRQAGEVLSRKASASPLDAGLLEGGFVVHMVAQHEAQHQETVLQAIALREDIAYLPTFVDETRPAPVEAVPPEASVLVPAGPFQMGTEDRIWAYDNERPAHSVELAAYRMDVSAVTNRAYLEFMEDGGYRRRELWSDTGWRWRQSERVEAPRHWRREARRWATVVFGHPLPLDLHRPVVHVSWHEANAFARWAGKRLPTEAEWEKAAAWDVGRGLSRRYPWGSDSPDRTRANLDQRCLEPQPAGTFPDGRSPYGCLQMLGDVWEWTASAFLPYPGFVSYPYREYSEIFFGDGYRVLRGGSFATAAIVARTTMRNWDFPERRQIFAGFRCAQDG